MVTQVSILYSAIRTQCVEGGFEVVLRFQFYIVRLEHAVGLCGEGDAQVFQFYIVRLERGTVGYELYMSEFQFYIVRLEPLTYYRARGRKMRRLRLQSYCFFLRNNVDVP